MSAPAAPIAPELQVVDRFLLAIPKSGFGKTYQFTASLIPQELAATSTGLAGKIVRFELFPDGVDMYESTQGLVVTEDLPARRLLASFTIVRQDDDKVVIDFNKGMRRVFTSSWTSGGGLDLADRDRVLEVPESRVFEMRQDKGRLIIRQSVQMRSRDFDANLEARYEMRYFLSPYKPGAFPGKEPSMVDSRYTRFFETGGQLEPGTGRVSSRIARFDVKHPVIFYYSANTPTNYIEAVRDAILYWNLAFGKEIVQAKKAPEGVTAPDAEYNIIQWVPWDNAGFAYADVLMDPLNGESEHGQAYITSVFAFGGRASARLLLRSMEEIAEAKKDGKKNGLDLRRSLPFLNSTPMCDIDPQTFAEQMAKGIQDVLASDELTDAAVLHLSQDYVREVVAHEVGHVLGLRHNFAGSLEGNLTRTELDDWCRAYVTGKSLDDYTNKIPSSSVMDYNGFKAAAFIGWRIRTLKQALPYDRAAIAWGYFDSPEAREKKMFFGTDEDTFRYGDVRRFDYGPDPVVNAYAENAHFIEMLPNTIIETFIRARAPHNPMDRVPLEQVNLSYTAYAFNIANEFADLLSWFRAETRSLRVENQFDFVGDLNRKERYQAHWQSLTNQLEQLGGVDRAAFSFMPVDLKLDLKDKPAGIPVAERMSATNLTARLEKLLVSTNYSTFVGLDEKKYSFTKEERELIVKRARKCFEELEKETVRQVCLRLNTAQRNLGVEANGVVGENDPVSKLEQRIIELAKLVILAKDDSKHITGKMDKAVVEVPEFKYDQATRLAAAHMLSPTTGSFRNWADEAKSDLNGDLKKEVDAALNLEHFKDFKASLLSRPLLEWYQQQQELLSQLPLPPPPAATAPK
ncbi:MAG: hypothetical protein JWQ04_3238 [Pedosphaera sp.]|nr:hypothetical protein [Pedosphaera sp.]